MLLKDTPLATIDMKIVDVTIPIHNENIENLLASLKKVDKYLKTLSTELAFNYNLTIACSAVPKATNNAIYKFVKNQTHMRFVRTEKKGRGRVLKEAWLSSNSDIVMYMDVDLATDLSSVQALLDPLLSGYTGIVIGNRRLKKSRVKRKAMRSISSAMYHRASRLFVGTKFIDMQCGFKAMPTVLAKKLIPKVKNNKWLFDSELLINAKNQKVKIKSVPITWNESPSTTVKFLKLASEMMKFINRMSVTQKRIITPERLLLVGLMLIASLIFLVNLTDNQWANLYYSAATQSASTSWKAFLFGGFDAQGFITIDKFPIVLWPSVFSVKLFGFSQFAVLLPHALTGIFSSLAIYKIVRRHFDITSGLAAGLIFIFSPLSTIMFRFNNPDSFLVLASILLLACVLKAMSTESWKYFLMTGVVLGLMFQIKTLQALIFLPILFVIVLWDFRVSKSLHSFVKKLILGGVVFLLTALSWPIFVSLTSPNSRPIIGGSASNNVWDLVFGYNGLSRLTGEGPAKVSGVPSAIFDGNSGFFRMFNSSFFSNIGWFLLPAIVCACFGIWYCFKNNNEQSRSQKRQLLFWSLVLLFYVFVFSIAKGKIHGYYSLILIPAISALLGISLQLARKHKSYGRGLLYWLTGSTVISVGVVIPFLLRSIDPKWFPVLFFSLIITGVLLAFISIFAIYNNKDTLVKLVFFLGLS